MSARLKDQIGTAETSHNVDSADAYRSWALQSAVMTFGFKPELDERGKPCLKQGGKLDAYISAGRWVCQCPCGNGCAAHPEWNLAICVECGIEYTLNLPSKKDRERAEKLLLERDHPNKRHWFPHTSVAKRMGLKQKETVNTLLQENDMFLEPKDKKNK